MGRLRRFLILFIIAVLVAISGVLMPRTVHADDPCYSGGPVTCFNDEPFNDVGVWTANQYAGFVCVWGWTPNMLYQHWCAQSLARGYSSYNPANATNWYDPGWMFGGYHDLQVYWLYADGTSTGYQHTVKNMLQYGESWGNINGDYFCVVYGGNPWMSNNWAYRSLIPCWQTNPGDYVYSGYNPFSAVDYGQPADDPDGDD